MSLINDIECHVKKGHTAFGVPVFFYVKAICNEDEGLVFSTDSQMVANLRYEKSGTFIPTLCGSHVNVEGKSGLHFTVWIQRIEIRSKGFELDCIKGRSLITA